MKTSKLFGFFFRVPLIDALRFFILFVTRRLMHKHAGIYFSQTGEDILLSSLLGEKKHGFYIDIGCFHPYKLSNTFHFYLNGWNGVAIDPNLGLVSKYKRKRFKDITIRAAISDKTERIVYRKYEKEAFNSIATAENKTARVVSEEYLNTVPLQTLLDNTLESGQTIDFMSIDVEGHELPVLRSFDFQKYSPTVLCIEIHGLDLYSFTNQPVVEFVQSKGYKLVAYAIMNAYFRKQ